MQQFPNVRQPALGIQDAVMLPAQSVGNLLMQRLAAAEAAFVPATTQNFDSTTSSTTLNATAATSTGGSLRSLLIPVGEDGFVPIRTNPSPVFNNLQFTQFGNQELIQAIIASQTRPGSSAGLAIFGAGGVELPGIGRGNCGCTCVRELSEETVIDEMNTNGINDNPDALRVAAPQTIPVVATQPAQQATAQVTIPVVTVPAAQAAAATATPAAAPMLVATPDTTSAANVQYVTYNA